MNFKITVKFVLALSSKENNKNVEGFTIIELLVVIIIVGILAAIALPNFLRQAGRARETEIINAVGTVNRSQQTYHYEKQEFAQGSSDAEVIDKLGLKFDHEYIDSYQIASDSNKATIAPVNNEFTDDGTRAYSAGIFVSGGNYTTIICQSVDVAKELTPPTNSTSCDAGESIR